MTTEAFREHCRQLDAEAQRQANFARCVRCRACAWMFVLGAVLGTVMLAMIVWMST